MNPIDYFLYQCFFYPLRRVANTAKVALALRVFRGSGPAEPVNNHLLQPAC